MTQSRNLRLPGVATTHLGGPVRGSVFGFTWCGLNYYVGPGVSCHDPTFVSIGTNDPIDCMSCLVKSGKWP